MMRNNRDKGANLQIHTGRAVRIASRGHHPKGTVTPVAAGVVIEAGDAVGVELSTGEIVRIEDRRLGSLRASAA
jgi:hypothetical protein